MYSFFLVRELLLSSTFNSNNHTNDASYWSRSFFISKKQFSISDPKKLLAVGSRFLNQTCDLPLSLWQPLKQKRKQKQKQKRKRKQEQEASDAVLASKFAPLKKTRSVEILETLNHSIFLPRRGSSGFTRSFGILIKLVCFAHFQRYQKGGQKCSRNLWWQGHQN